ncbi:hypothetical protein AB4Y88_00470 [Paenarthrobacter sp. RAF9]
MDNRAKKLIFIGIIVSLIGSIIAVSTAYLTGLVEASIDRNLVAGVWLAKVVISVVQFGVAPFGAALTAIGFTLHWLDGSTLADKTTGNARHEADASQDID